MKFGLSLGRPSSKSMGHSSSQPVHHSSPFNIGDVYAHDEKRRLGFSHAGTSSSASLAMPPPYTSAVDPEDEAHLTAAAGSSKTSHTFASRDRVRDIAYLQAPMRRQSKENALDMLRQYDTVIIMDDSGSMSQDHRWQQASEALSELAEIAASYDEDGIDIHFLNHPKSGTNIKDPERVRKLFRHVVPNGLTPIANKLDVLVGDYVTGLEEASRRKKKGDASALAEIKPVNFIVITDGAPTDEPLDSIVSLARRLDRGNYPLAQVGIQFVQIGNDSEATEFLKQLDDDLSGTYGVRDIVDTTPFLGIKLTAEMLIKILLGGINRRVDRRGGEAV